jgi:OHCU decarboxylase
MAAKLGRARGDKVMITLEALNAMTRPEFVAALRGVFEHTDWVAARAARSRPFRSRLELLAAMRTQLAQAPAEEQLALICAHPQLRARSVLDPALTAASTQEQRRAGLEGCTPAEAQRLEELNGAYLAKFGFPFILAVRGHDPPSIIRRCEQRLRHDAGIEQATALREIGRIAEYRLAERVPDAAA